MTPREQRLPLGWCTTRLGDVAEIRLGRQRSPSHASGAFMRPYLRAANATWSGLDLADVKTMNFSLREQPSYRLQPGDILLAEASGSAKEVGKPVIWNSELPECYFQNTLIRVRAPKRMERFMLLQLRGAALSGRFVDHSKGVGIHHLGSERLSSFEIVVAPLAEQERIVAAAEQELGRIDVAIDQLKQAARRVLGYRASVLKAACEGRLVPTEAERARTEGGKYEPADQLLARILRERRARWEADQLAKFTAKGRPPRDAAWKKKYVEPKPPTELPELPEGWAWATVAQVSHRVQYGTSARATALGPGVPVLRMGNITEGRLDLTDLKFLPVEHLEFPELLLEDGDLLFNRTNSAELVGKTAVYRGTPAPCSFASYLIRVRLASSVSPHLVAHALNGHRGRTWIRSVVSQQVGQANVNGSKLSSYSVPLPPLAEQRRIVAEVERRLSIADEAEATIETALTRAERLRQSILKRAFEGRLVPQDPNDEPASVLLERIRKQREAEGQSRGRQFRPRGESGPRRIRRK